MKLGRLVGNEGQSDRADGGPECRGDKFQRRSHFDEICFVGGILIKVTDVRLVGAVGIDLRTDEAGQIHLRRIWWKTGDRYLMKTLAFAFVFPRLVEGAAGRFVTCKKRSWYAAKRMLEKRPGIDDSVLEAF